MNPRLLTLCLLLPACGEPDTDDTAPGTDGCATTADGGATTADDGGGTAVDCWSLGPEECLAAGCQTIRAREVIPDGTGGWCVDLDLPFESLGCMPADSDCGAINSYATAPTLPDACYQFTTACIVPGWQDCAEPAMETPVDCP